MCPAHSAGRSRASRAGRYRPCSPEQPPVRPGTVQLDMFADHRDQHGRDGNPPDRVARTALRPAGLVYLTIVSPAATGRRADLAEFQHPPGPHRQRALVKAAPQRSAATALPAPRSGLRPRADAPARCCVPTDQGGSSPLPDCPAPPEEAGIRDDCSAVKCRCAADAILHSRPGLACPGVLGLDRNRHASTSIYFAVRGRVLPGRGRRLGPWTWSEANSEGHGRAGTR